MNTKNIKQSKKMINEIKLKCPRCKAGLAGLDCPQCSYVYKKEGNVFYFSKAVDDFYEGKFIENKDAKGMLPSIIPEVLKKHIWKFFVKTSLILRYQEFFCKYLDGIKKKKDKLDILDLACGGGNNFLKEFGDVYGVDISKQSIEVARKNYDYCFVADIFNLPFEDKMFDAVVSFELVEHVSEDKLDMFLKEVKRVLKDDGLSLHYYVVDSQCVLGRFIKKYPDLYEKYFVANDGHFGLLTAGESLSRFKDAFEIVKYRNIFSKMLMPLGIVKYFDNEYAEKNIFIRFLVKISKVIVNNVYLHSISSILLYPIYLFNDFFKKENDGFNVVRCVKK